MEKELFNPKTIEKFCSKVILTPLQKKSAKEWLKLLDEGKLKKERESYPSFMTIILKDLLGYDISLDSLKHEDKNMEFSFEDENNNKFVCFEAKGTDTKDLWAYQHRDTKARETPVNQINDYLYKLVIPYGILTNYKIFVLFDRNKGYESYHKFDFSEIKDDEEKLKEFVAIFSKNSLGGNFIKELEEASSVEDRNFTKEFYKLFHETRLMLIKDFEENGLTKEEAVHYAQVYLNRLMFIFFAEDTGLLDERYFEEKILQVLKTGILDKHSDYISTKIKNMFLELNKEIPRQIKGFNGGLFKDELPRNVCFNDMREDKFFKDIYKQYKLDKKIKLFEQDKEIFEKYSNKINPVIKNLLLMASFDFKTEVNVNILGHIFEQSLTDLGDLQEGVISKRKKDGIFYTPEYITEYICRNTIIPYLSGKKATTSRELVLEYKDNIEELEVKFKKIKILDPACGSGAFLIKAVDILLNIQKEIQLFKQNEGEYIAIKVGRKVKKNKTQFNLLKWKEEDEARDIISNNIFGVDINEESVEITKLSLFLKTARKNKKLPVLDSNIKCGNSLIDDKTVDVKAFKWEDEFKEIINGGGFDVVIGNPPYVNSKQIIERDYLWKKYAEVLIMDLDLYEIFIYSGINNLLKDEGHFGFITPDSYFANQSFEKLRNFLIKNTQIINIVDFPYRFFPFDEVNTETAILILKKKRINKQDVKVNKIIKNEVLSLPLIYHNPKIVSIPMIKNTNCFFINMSKMGISIVSRIKDRLDFNEYFKLSNPSSLDRKKRYPKTRLRKYDKCVFDSIDLKNDSELKEISAPCIEGDNILRYLLHGQDKFTNISWNEGNKIKTINSSTLNFMREPKLVGQRITGQAKYRIVFTYDENKYITMPSVNIINLIKANENKDILFYLLGILNSTLYNFLYKDIFAESNTNITSDVFTTIPFPAPDLKIIPEKVKYIIQLNKELYDKKFKFINRIQQNLKLQKITKKLDNFFDLDFKQFCEELKKQKIEFSLKKQDEWEDYFNQYIKELLKLKEDIETTNKEIDEMVYKLYGITDKERKIIEEI
ncbi:MAG: N-6 DNA methylase [Candidatus Aenigmarchaeota archaeon]|nr:N-6 DNA methylase [Candidatus Aenigmarchaeota archaeon]